jgi:RHS repeat-associated protein
MTDYLYQGMSLDPVTGLYYERNRNYSPSLGTWTSQDPLQYINGANTYQFVGSDPVGMVDPEGNIAWYYWVAAGAVNGLLGGPEDPFGDAAAGLILEDGAQVGAAASAEQAAEDAAAQAAKKLAEKAAEEAIKDAEPEGQYCPASDIPEAAKSAPKPSPNFVEPTNAPQLPPTELPPGHSVRVMPPTEQYPNGYWIQTNEAGQPINPATGKPPGNVTRPIFRSQVHVPLPPPEGQ